jgi:hypothetical protein
VEAAKKAAKDAGASFAKLMKDLSARAKAAGACAGAVCTPDELKKFAGYGPCVRVLDMEETRTRIYTLAR